MSSATPPQYTPPELLPETPQALESPPQPTRPSAASASASPDQLNALWQSLLDRIQDKPALSWARRFTLRRLEDRVAVIEALPGAGDLRKFADEKRRHNLAAILSPLIGRTVQITFDTHTPSNFQEDFRENFRGQGDFRGEYTPEYPHNPTPAQGPVPLKPIAAQRSPIQAQPDRTTPPAQSDRLRAAQLPLVKKISQLFDATILDVRPEDNSALDTAQPDPGASQYNRDSELAEPEQPEQPEQEDNGV